MKPLKQLSELNQMEKAKRYPSVPAHAIPVKKYSDTKANKLTNAIIEWLTLNGCWATRVSSAGRWLKGDTFTDVIGRTRQLNGKFIPSTTKKGTADIMAIIEGQHVSIEVKIGRDRLSEAQMKVKADIEKAGGIYFIAHDFDEFMKFYKILKNDY